LIVGFGLSFRNGSAGREEDLLAARMTEDGEPDSTFGSGGEQTASFTQGGCFDDAAGGTVEPRETSSSEVRSTASGSASRHSHLQESPTRPSAIREG